MTRPATVRPRARVVAAEQRFRARRRAGRRRALRPTLLAAIAVTLAGGLLWAALLSPLLAARTVTVKGTSRLSAAAVTAAADVPRGRSLLLISPGAVARRVERLAPVAHATVDRSWPHRLVIHVSERRPALAAATPAGTELLDATGVPFAHVAAPPAGVRSVTVAADVPGSGAAAAQAAVRVWTQLPATLRQRVRGLQAPSPDDVTLLLRDGRRVVWGGSDGAATKLAVVTALLRRHGAHVIDVSSPDVAVTR